MIQCEVCDKSITSKYYQYPVLGMFTASVCISCHDEDERQAKEDEEQELLATINE